MPASGDNLRRELRRIAWLGVGLLAAMVLMLASTANPGLALRWLPASLACWLLVLWSCRQRLSHNHSPDGRIFYGTLGAGNRVTLFRGLLIAATAGFLVLPTADLPVMLLYCPALLYTVAALADALDGYLARRQQQTTRLGTELDTVYDALGLLVAPLLAVLYGKLHFSYLLVSIAYYLFRGGISWRERRGRPVFPLPPSKLRRQLAGFQMGLVATVLWPPLSAEITRPAGVLFMVPVLLGFLRDWLHVSGRLGRDREAAS